MHKWVPRVQRVRNVPLTGKPSVSRGEKRNSPHLEAGISACHQKPSFPLSHLQVGTRCFSTTLTHKVTGEAAAGWGTRTASWTSLKAQVQRDIRDLEAFFYMADAAGAQEWVCSRGPLSRPGAGIRRTRPWPEGPTKLGTSAWVGDGAALSDLEIQTPATAVSFVCSQLYFGRARGEATSGFQASPQAQPGLGLSPRAAQFPLPAPPTSLVRLFALRLRLGPPPHHLGPALWPLIFPLLPSPRSI